MMFHSHLPLHYWVEAFATASYISNLLPSAALNSRSPYECLFKTKPDYSSLRAFSAACYPCLEPLQAHKFDPKSFQCVFLGYSSLHKGIDVSTLHQEKSTSHDMQHLMKISFPLKISTNSLFLGMIHH